MKNYVFAKLTECTSFVLKAAPYADSLKNKSMLFESYTSKLRTSPQQPETLPYQRPPYVAPPEESRCWCGAEGYYIKNGVAYCSPAHMPPAIH